MEHILFLLCSLLPHHSASGTNTLTGIWLTVYGDTQAHMGIRFRPINWETLAQDRKWYLWISLFQICNAERIYCTWYLGTLIQGVPWPQKRNFLSFSVLFLGVKKSTGKRQWVFKESFSLPHTPTFSWGPAWTLVWLFTRCQWSGASLPSSSPGGRLDFVCSSPPPPPSTHTWSHKRRQKPDKHVLKRGLHVGSIHDNPRAHCGGRNGGRG